MKPLTISFTIWLFSAAFVHAQGTDMQALTAEPVMIGIEARKEALFLQYQDDTARLAAQYDDAVRALSPENPSDFNRQKMLLEKEFKQQKRDLLRQFRADKKALKQHEPREEVAVPESAPETPGIRERLEAARKLDPVIGTRRPPPKKASGGYVKSGGSKMDRKTKEYKKRISNTMSNLKKRSQTISSGANK